MGLGNITMGCLKIKKVPKSLRNNALESVMRWNALARMHVHTEEPRDVVEVLLVH